MSETPGYETRDMNSRLAVLVLAGTLALLVLVVIALWLVFRPHQGGTPALLAPGLFSQALRPASEPRLETRPAGDLVQEIERARRHLNRYGWIDRERGIAHIPITRAMELYVRQQRPHAEQRPSAAPPPSRADAHGQ